MKELVALAVVLVAIGLLSYWNSRLPKGRGDELARRAQERGGTLGGGL